MSRKIKYSKELKIKACELYLSGKYGAIYILLDYWGLVKKMMKEFVNGPEYIKYMELKLLIISHIIINIVRHLKK